MIQRAVARAITRSMQQQRRRDLLRLGRHIYDVAEPLRLEGPAAERAAEILRRRGKAT